MLLDLLSRYVIILYAHKDIDLTLNYFFLVLSCAKRCSMIACPAIACPIYEVQVAEAKVNGDCQCCPRCKKPNFVRTFYVNRGKILRNRVRRIIKHL